jgi:hypothetical protein
MSSSPKLWHHHAETAHRVLRTLHTISQASRRPAGVSRLPAWHERRRQRARTCVLHTRRRLLLFYTGLQAHTLWQHAPAQHRPDGTHEHDEPASSSHRAQQKETRRGQAQPLQGMARAVRGCVARAAALCSRPAPANAAHGQAKGRDRALPRQRTQKTSWRRHTSHTQ